MAMFVKCVRICELECLGMVLRSPVYSACGVVLIVYFAISITAGQKINLISCVMVLATYRVQ